MNAGSSLIDARPHVLPSQTTRIATALGTAFVTISRDSAHQPMEVFVSVGKAGSETFAAAEALGRLVSLALRLDSSVPRSARAREIASQLTRIGATVNVSGPPSIAEALSRVMLADLEESLQTAPKGTVASRTAQVAETPSSETPIFNLESLAPKTVQGRKPMATPTVPLSPTLLAAAEHLAEQLALAGPVAAYQLAKARMNGDAHARGLLERLSAAQSDVRLRQSSGGVTQPDLDSLRALQGEVQSNAVITQYARTQQEALAYLPQINQEISELIGVDFASLAGPASC